MFAAGVTGDKLFSSKSMMSGAIHGYDVEIDSGFLKFDIDGEWHYPSAFPVNRFYICRSRNVGYNPATEVYFCFKEWFGYGHWLMEDKPNFWRRKSRQKSRKEWSSVNRPWDWLCEIEGYRWVKQVRQMGEYIVEMADALGLLWGHVHNG